jgi:Transposase IS66 family
LRGAQQWLWVAASSLVACFRIDPARSQRAAKELLGEEFGGFVVSDRYAGYHLGAARSEGRGSLEFLGIAWLRYGSQPEVCERFCLRGGERRQEKRSGAPKSVLLISTSTTWRWPRDHRLRHPLSRTLRAGR